MEKRNGQITNGYNSTYPKGGVSCSADTFVQAGSSVLRMKFCGKNPALRAAANRQVVKKLPCIDQIFGYLSDKNFIQAILKGSVLVYSHSAVMRQLKRHLCKT